MRKKAIVALLLVWILAVAAVIFWLSSQTGEESGNVSKGLMEKLLSFLRLDGNREKLHHLIRKAAHMTEYAVLGASVCVLHLYLTATGRWKKSSYIRAAVYALAFSALFAVTDEIHQAFVPGRGPAVRDVLIDTLGAAVGVGLVCLVYRYKQKRRSKTSKKLSQPF